MTPKEEASSTDFAELDVPLERDVFLRSLIGALSGSLQDIIGLDEASGFISIVGQRIGLEINDQYRQALHADALQLDQVGAALVDLKRRINGGFYIISIDADKIVLGNTRCPFEEKVEGRPALCMMTSNVFGSIAAENLGYARVELEETIALGDSGCRVVVHLNADSTGAGREYYRG